MSLVVGSNLKFKQVTSTPSETPASGEILLYSTTGDALLVKPNDNVERAVRITHTVKVATTGVITLSGTQTIDSVVCGVGDRVLVHHQGTFVGGNSFDNGIWVVASGAWTRAADANTSAKISGAEVFVTSGTVYAQKMFKTTFLSTDTLGTTACKWYGQGSVIEVGDLFGVPFQAVPGHAYFASPDRILQIWGGVSWLRMKGVQDYGSTAPLHPETGEIWIDNSMSAPTPVNPMFKGSPVTLTQTISTGANIAFTAAEDTHAGWQSGTNTYTVQVAGLYRLTATFKWNGTPPAAGPSVLFFKNGASAYNGPNALGTTGFCGCTATALLRCAVSDSLAARVGNAGFTLQSDTPAENTFFTIEYVRP